MCGISGIIFLKKDDNKIEQYLRSANIMLENQNPRGPDASNIYTDNSCILSHNRLSILDLNETGNQPMQFGDWIITFNGEIYNFLELKNILIENNIHLNGSSDTEVLLKLISLYGVDTSLEKIRGIFAFCAYNKKNKEFYLARDRMGEKPLFYLNHEGNIYFSSNPSSIVRAIPNKGWQLDREALWQFFKMGGLFSRKTLFLDIERIDSAEVICIKDDKIERKYYWKPKFKKNINENDLINELNLSIKQKLIADVPVVLFLSGGVDSSYVASIARGIDCVHLDSDEIILAKEVAKIVGSSFREVKPENFDIKKILIDYSGFSGEPTMAGFIPYVISNAISKQYKVAITANGADELFFGYNRTPTPLIGDEFYDNLYRKQKISINSRAMNHDHQMRHIFRDDKSFTVYNSTSNNLTLLNLINNEIEKLDSEMPISARYRWLELMTYVKGDLNLTLDYASMANSLEVRAPFLDHIVVEMALSLDDTKHIKAKYGRKHILKDQLLKNGIPENIWQREKLGFSLNNSYLKTISYLKDIATSDLEKNGYLKISKDTKGRDLEYLRSAALGFWAWKSVWIDSGIVGSGI
jgi:asparagine synthase (glutamine-hydrolysing)